MENITKIKKRIKHKANNLGTKEMTILFSDFVQLYLDNLTPLEILSLDNLLNADDHYIYEKLMHRSKYQNTTDKLLLIMELLKNK